MAQNWNIQGADSFDTENRGLYFNDILVCPFLSEKAVKSKDYNLYIYVEITANGELYLKLGKTSKSMFERYSIGQGIEKEYLRTIFLCNYESGDEPVHRYLHELCRNTYSLGFIPANKNNSDENYLIVKDNGVHQFLKFVEKCVQVKNAVAENVPLYTDIFNSVCEIYTKIKTNNNFWNILYFCTRAGKTRTNLSLCELFNNEARISVMCSYVGTVKNSYINAIKKVKQYYDNFMFVDFDKVNENSVNEIVEWLESDENNHVMFYLALTGDNDNFDNRTKILNNKQIKKYTKLLFIEEADFGAHCENQIKKIRKIHGAKYAFITTGTGFSKLQKFVGSDEYNIFYKEYINDILLTKNEIEINKI